MPSRRRRSSAALSFVLFAGTWSVAGSAAPAPAPDRCAAVKPSPAFTFQGRKLEVAPDITEPELRRVDALMQWRCGRAGYEALVAYLQAHPDDYHAEHIQASMAWRNGDATSATLTLDAVIARHPDYHTAKVMRASLARDQGQFALAERYLNEVEAASPTDLWAYLGRLRLQVRRDQSLAAAGTLLVVAQDPHFEGDAREIAARTVIEMPGLPPDKREAAYRAQLDFESATPFVMKATNYARILIEEQEKFAEGRVLLKRALAGPDSDYEGAHALMAESYLLEAVKIDPVPTSRNASLVAAAKEALGGDLSDLQPRVAQWPHLRKLSGLLPDVRTVDARDRNGDPGLCSAVTMFDVVAVQQLLERGAEVDGDCEGTTPYGLILRMAGRRWEEERAILKTLYEHGADPNPVVYPNQPALEVCKDEMVCTKELLPLLEQQAKAGKRAK